MPSRARHLEEHLAEQESRLGSVQQWSFGAPCDPLKLHASARVDVPEL